MESWIGFVRSRFNEISLNNGLLNCSIERKHGDYQMVPKKRDEKLSRLRNVFKLEEEKKIEGRKLGKREGVYRMDHRRDSRWRLIHTFYRVYRDIHRK